MQRLELNRPQQRDELPSFIEALPMYPGRIIVSRGMIRLFIFVFGFLLQCNVIPTAFGLPFLRITDMIVITTIPIFYIIYIRMFNSTIILIHLVPVMFALLMSLIFLTTEVMGSYIHPFLHSCIYFIFFRLLSLYSGKAP